MRLIRGHKSTTILQKISDDSAAARAGTVRPKSRSILQFLARPATKSRGYGRLILRRKVTRGGANGKTPDDAFWRCLMWPTTASCVAVTVVALKVETFGQVQYWLVLSFQFPSDTNRTGLSSRPQPLTH